MITGSGNIKLLSSLPEYMRDEYRSLLIPSDTDPYLLRLVKAADRLSALIKCIEEEQMGNKEFIKAKAEITDSLVKTDLEEVRIFMRDFLPSYSLSLDEQNISL